MRNTLTKILSITTSLALLVTSFTASAGAIGAPTTVAMPDFVKALTPPAQLGDIASYYQGQTEHPVVLIEDLHANYGVQKKIRSLLEYLQPKTTPTGRQMVLGMEGAWGELNLSSVRNEPENIRRIAADSLLKNVEISAMEHFAALTPDVRLVGIENPDDYIVHVELFRKSLAARLALARKTDQLREAINGSRGDAPKALRRLWVAEENFHAGKIGLPELSKILDIQVGNLREAEEALAREKAELVKKQEGPKAFFLNNVVEADQNLSLLSRLLRQELTLEEVQYATKRIPAILATVQALLPKENLNLWNDTIRTAIDHYAIAIMRDKPMSDHVLELTRANTDVSVVVVTGGFHTAGIAETLKQHKVSYVVIAPIVESHTAKDEALYVERMMDIHVSETQLAASMEVRSSAQSVIPIHAIVAFVSGIRENVAKLWPESLRLARGQAPEAQPADQTSQAQVIESLITDSKVEVPGLSRRVINFAMAKLGKGPSVKMAAPLDAATSADVSLSKVSSAESSPLTATVTQSAIATGMLVAAVGAYAQRAPQSPAIHKLATIGDSTALIVAGGLAAVAGFHLWATKTNSGKRTLDVIRRSYLYQA